MMKDTIMGKDGLMTQALFALKAARTKDMLDLILEAIDMYPHVSKRDRSLIGVAIKNVIDPIRFAIIRVSDTMCDSSMDKYDQLYSITKKRKEEVTLLYREELMKELQSVASRCLKRIGSYDCGLIGHNDDPETKVFFFKLAGDLTRYMAESTRSGTERRHYATLALDNYKLALNESHALSPCNPVRLSAVLNFSVFYFEILNAVENASALAQRCFNEALESLHLLHEDTYEESMGLLDTLHSNIVLWQHPETGDGESLRSKHPLNSSASNERSRAESSKAHLFVENDHSISADGVSMEHPRRGSAAVDEFTT